MRESSLPKRQRATPAKTGFLGKTHGVECSRRIGKLHFVRSAVISVISKVQIIGIVIEYNFAIITAGEWLVRPGS